MNLYEELFFLFLATSGIALVTCQLAIHGWDLDDVFFEEAKDE